QVEDRDIHSIADAADQREAKEPRQRIECHLSSHCAPLACLKSDRNGMVKYARRFASTRPRVTVSRMRPHVKLRKLKIASAAANSAVGSRGTKPVCMNSTMTGIPSSKHAMASIAAPMEKNASGRSSFANQIMVFRILQPSL